MQTGQSLSADRQAAGFFMEKARQSSPTVIAQKGFAVPVAQKGCQAEAWRYMGRNAPNGFAEHGALRDGYVAPLFRAAGFFMEKARQSSPTVIAQKGFCEECAQNGCQAEAWRYVEQNAPNGFAEHGALRDGYVAPLFRAACFDVALGLRCWRRRILIWLRLLIGLRLR
jgi:hypothetical protein